MPGRSCNALITKISQSTLGLRENELSRETVKCGTENVIWASFGPVSNTEKTIGPIMSIF